MPGWDCHGLPIEWKIEEEYRARGKDKDAVDIVEFRRECRAFAARWMDVQREEFKRLGVEGDWDRPYATMDFPAEAQIAREIMAFAMSDQLYRGSKPVMWSAVEKTALAEAEIEYHEKVSPTVVVKFPIVDTLDGDLTGAAVLIWTTTPWTIPANRAVAYGPGIAYGLYRVTEAPADNWAKPGERLCRSPTSLRGEVFGAARVTAYERVKEVLPAMIARLAHPFRALPGANGFWDFDVPVFPADYVTDDAGTGFVHTAPGHGADDYNTFVKHKETFAAMRHAGGAAHGRRGFRVSARRAAVCRRAHLRRQGQGRRRERGRHQRSSSRPARSSPAGASSISTRIPGARRRR